ncbi:MAG: serine--tRNA ligase [Firmicutes bacterium]|uniref:Serine--tRNA ligase n=1 Tax=Candidatus Scatoplasma merdavium TaxID=2840932 RepID=A0A9D9GRJ4_9BACL|nr:serine--tRNA ligase [Candidatus Scatoplasma merdavium]
MLDIKYVREHLEEVIERLNTRNGDYSYLREIPSLDAKRRELIKEGDGLKAFRNEQSKLVGQYKREGKDASEIVSSIASIKDKIANIDVELNKIDEEIRQMLLKTPNLPDKSLPVGKDDTFNRVEKVVGTPRKFDFKPLAHWDLGLKDGGFDFERAVKVSSPRFVFYKGAIAKLERAVASFMLDTHVKESGYTEVLPPYMVNTDSMYGTGQLPKFKDDAYKIEGQEMWLISTAEIPVTNYYRDEILDADQLPIKYCAYSSCFRSEAGSAGRDTRGIIRVHQFQKVELVNFVKPEDSWDALEHLTRSAELILEKLELPYRRVCLSTGDVGFSSAKTFDLEVWLPSYNNYKEISSCSNFLDYQARRMNLRFRREKGAPTEYVHTLNGSGLAIGRTVAAIMENYQNADGSITVPEVLRPYMGTDIIK